MEDVLWKLVPGFEVNIGRGASNLDLSLITRYEIRRYFEEDQLDSELFSIRAQGTYRSSRLDWAVTLDSARARPGTGNSNIVGDLVETDNIRRCSEWRIPLFPEV